MSRLFISIVNMSISASWLIAAVLIVRLVIKKAPGWIHVLLWGIVALRLIVPFSVESALSLVPGGRMIPDMVFFDSGFAEVPEITPSENPTHMPEYGDPDAGNRSFGGSAVPSDYAPGFMDVLAGVWLAGVFLLISYSVLGFFRLRGRIRTAVIVRENIYQSENINSAFVLGLLRPRIYLPFRMDRQNLEYVILHEQAHIRRRDYFWKPLGFLLLAVYWFNPLVWLSYVLLCRDIELACDEKVVRELGREQRADYSQALLACSVRRRSIAACPLAFGEVGVKGRVKSVLHYKKPAFWVTVAAVAVCLIVAVCFLTDPVQPVEASPQDGEDITQTNGTQMSDDDPILSKDDDAAGMPGGDNADLLDV
ncbi:MAG: hypothetical protein HDR26_04930, partial [Lachnospiraceae bacterium]|nr:hypothetical protein [Lachnospiraceae bacterium]